MNKLAPSILAADPAALAEAAALVSAAHLLHVDVMDGHFVPNLSFGPAVVKALRRVTALPLDVHLMMLNPSAHLDAFLDAGADTLSVHAEVETPDALRAALRHIRACGVRAGLVLNPETPADAILPFLGEFDQVLCMTVNPGYGAQRLLPEALRKLPEVKAILNRNCPDCDLEVDGGVTPRNARELLALGANILVAGSAVFGAADVPQAVAEFLALLA
jgi:ribulose-phosphate 3-epimerase